MRIGADIGGTFTDLVLAAEDGRFLAVEKRLTTHRHPDDAVIEGVQQLLAKAGLAGSAIRHVVHGTTLFTNALLERKGARTALVTTAGFRDVIEIGREHRYDMYDLRLCRPSPLAPRRLRFEVRERVLADGTVRVPLCAAGLERVIEALRAEAVEAVAVALLHSYANDCHERQVGAAIAEALKGVAVTLSSAVAPEIREFERTSTALANAYVQGIAARYLTRLEERLARECGIEGALFIMQSNGGICGVPEAVRFPVRLVESGPAAGALFAARFGHRLGIRQLVSFDMGGTTAKSCVITGAAPPLATGFEVARAYLFRKGSGLPLRIPAVEMIEIGTGGGSIAHIDALGRLQVGPESAGAHPGPVCYGNGGHAPTVTDADLLLGYLDAGFFAGGSMALDVAAARAAVARQIAEPLGLDVQQAAWAIHRVANESMAAAARVHAVERGVDSGGTAILAFGGAGPVHALGVAAVLGAARVIYPESAGVMSAFGLLSAPLALHCSRSRPEALDGLDWVRVQALFEEMEAEARDRLGAAGDAVTMTRSADLRYRRQGYEVATPLAAGMIEAQDAVALREAFEQAYRAIYGQIVREAPVEVVTWRLVAAGLRPALVGAADAAPRNPVPPAERAIYLPEVGRLERVPVYRRAALPRGAEFPAPAVIEEPESTVVLNRPGWVRVDPSGALLVETRAP